MKMKDAIFTKRFLHQVTSSTLFLSPSILAQSFHPLDSTSKSSPNNFSFCFRRLNRFSYLIYYLTQNLKSRGFVKFCNQCTLLEYKNKIMFCPNSKRGKNPKFGDRSLVQTQVWVELMGKLVSIFCPQHSHCSL